MKLTTTVKLMIDCYWFLAFLQNHNQNKLHQPSSLRRKNTFQLISCYQPATILQMVFLPLTFLGIHGLLTTNLIGVDLKPIDFLDSKVDNWNRNAEI